MKWNGIRQNNQLNYLHLIIKSNLTTPLEKKKKKKRLIIFKISNKMLNKRNKPNFNQVSS